MKRIDDIQAGAELRCRRHKAVKSNGRLGGLVLGEIGKLGANPDMVKMRLFLACFYGLVGERALFLAEEERALSADLNAWELHYLAGVHAVLGETERAAELLLSTVRRGRLHTQWKLLFDLASLSGIRMSAM